MSLSHDEVRKIAFLARLQIDEVAIPEYARNLSNILDFVAQMRAVDTHGILPMAHPQDVTQRLRPDTVTEADIRDEVQHIAPRTEAGLYLVPKVIE
ncbi:MAG: Asp-tRNA(Asn)/Glu-tRNA(Gln) amidotransferase subunit GatC [Thiotrichales bacterium]